MGDRQQVVQQPLPQLDVRHIVRDAQSRWLRPAEISEVLHRYLEVNLKTSPAPPYQPPSGSLFLFDRKALRYFRKDGHNWRKKKDGKTVKEAHERLKVGSVNALHCYYAHGEENVNFQRRSYWLLEGAHEHIVLVHYLEALQGNRSSVFRLHDHSLERQFHQLSAKQQARSPEVNGASPTSVEADDDEVDDQVVAMGVIRRPVSLMDQLSEPPGTSQDNCPGSSQATIVSPMKQENKLGITNSDIDALLGISDLQDGNSGNLSSPNWNDFLETVQHENMGDMGTWADMLEHSRRQEASDKYLDSLTQTPLEIQDNRCNEAMNQPAHSPASFVGESQHQNQLEALGSFGRWIAEEIKVPAGSPGTDSDAFLSSTFDERAEHDTALSYEENMPSVHITDQKFRIIDYSPDWAYAYEETKILVSGEYLVNAYEHKWCCMFGQTEVEVDILPTGVMRCKVPPQPPGTVPFYITCNNRMACSEVRDFEFRTKGASSVTSPNDSALTTAVSEDLLLRLKLVRMLCSEEAPTKNAVSDVLSNKIRSFFRKVPEDCEAIVESVKSGASSTSEIKDRIFDVFAQMKLQDWLLRHAGSEGKGPCVYDKEGQGLLHIVSALGLEWALAPILAAGVVVNFRDSHGWTGLHWAAYYGRENTILSLLAAKAVPELLTDPSTAHPNGQTAADVASVRGHTGIAGYLAEAALQHHLSVLTLKDDSLNEIHYSNASLAAETAANFLFAQERSQSPEDEAFLKQSLTAVRRATEAAALIQSAFRVFSFRKKQEMEEAALLETINNDNVEFVMAAKKIQNAYRGHQTKKRTIAATKIQSKFRGWKGRHDYLLTRQRIIKIQAHVRGYQARKQYRKILWSVGVLEKVVLRWHRRRLGLRGFQAEERMTENEADDDFLQEARKQKEHVIESSVERVQAMVHSPEARAQYARMRAVSEQNQIKLDYEMLENYMT